MSCLVEAVGSVHVSRHGGAHSTNLLFNGQVLGIILGVMFTWLRHPHKPQDSAYSSSIWGWDKEQKKHEPVLKRKNTGIPDMVGICATHLWEIQNFVGLQSELVQYG